MLYMAGALNPRAATPTMETTLKEFIRHSDAGFKARLLASSIMANNAGQVRALLAAGVSIRCHPYDYDIPLIWAISLSKMACVRVLLEAGAPVVPSPTSKDPVTLAVERGSLAIVRLLLRRGAKANMNQPTRVTSARSNWPFCPGAQT